MHQAYEPDQSHAVPPCALCSRHLIGKATHQKQALPYCQIVLSAAHQKRWLTWSSATRWRRRNTSAPRAGGDRCVCVTGRSGLVIQRIPGLQVVHGLDLLRIAGLAVEPVEVYRPQCHIDDPAGAAPIRRAIHVGLRMAAIALRSFHEANCIE